MSFKGLFNNMLTWSWSRLVCRVPASHLDSWQGTTNAMSPLSSNSTLFWKETSIHFGCVKRKMVQGSLKRRFKDISSVLTPHFTLRLYILVTPQWEDTHIRTRNTSELANAWKFKKHPNRNRQLEKWYKQKQVGRSLSPPRCLSSYLETSTLSQAILRSIT